VFYNIYFIFAVIQVTVRFFGIWLTCFYSDNFNDRFMKKLLSVIISLAFAGSVLFAQNTQTIIAQPGQTVVVQPGQTVVVAQPGQPVQVAPAKKPASSGPSVRLHGYATYALADNHVDSYYSATSYFDGSVEGGFQYGGGLEVMPYPAVGLEFTYLRLDSKAPMYYWDPNAVIAGEKFSEFDLAQNWLFLSFNKYVPLNPKVEPFAGFQIGMDIIDVTNPDNDNSTGSTKFAWGAKLGVNIWASEKVGLKLQAGLLSAVQAVGGGLYFGTGGAGAGVSSFSTYYQVNFGGGLVFKLK